MATLNLNEKKIPSAENLRLLSSLILSLSSKQGAIENKLINNWVASTAYIKDESFVIYDELLYVCKISNADDTFDKNKWICLSPTIEELTKTDIEALVNLTSEQITNLQSLIDDTSISTTRTNSSSHIYMAIQGAIAECKDDTLKQIAKKVSGSYKIANTTADIVSADYIYLLSNGSNYDLYVLVDGTATKVGDTNINLSEYVKTTDLADYMKTADADGKFATITTVDGKADKSEIPITLPANGGNADTVNNHTVKSDVPENAVFTDTVYDDTEVNAKLGELDNSINGFKNVQIVSALGSVNLKEIIQSEFTKLKNGRGMIKISDGTTLYCGTYIKYSNTQGSATFTNVEGTSYIWIIRGDTITLQELATMDKVNALHKETVGYITGSLLGSVVKDANLYYQKFGDTRLVINGWVSIDAVSARTPIFTLPNNWKANSNYLLPCYVENSNVACACAINIAEGTVNSYTPLPATREVRFCGEIYLM